METKTEKILKHLQKRKKITSLDAIELYGCTRLASVIFNLKGRGHEIITHIVQDKNGTKWGVYRYLGQSHA